MFSCEFCEISNNTFFYRTPPGAASVHYRHSKSTVKWLNHQNPTDFLTITRSHTSQFSLQKCQHHKGKTNRYLSFKALIDRQHLETFAEVRVISKMGLFAKSSILNFGRGLNSPLKLTFNHVFGMCQWLFICQNLFSKGLITFVLWSF